MTTPVFTQTIIKRNPMDATKVTAYMPLIQQLSKYAFFLLCLVIFAPQVITLLDATEQRLLSGGEVSIGLDGIKIGEAPKMPVNKSVSTEIGRSLFLGTGLSGGGSGSVVQGPPPVKGYSDISRIPTEDLYHLVHGAAKDKNDYAVKVSLDAIEPGYLDKVEKVVYHLHESFDNSDREVTDRSSGFALTFNAWGQFEVKADVYVRGRADPIRLRRWLNF